MGKSLLALLVTMAVPLPALAQSIAQGYPGDAGIQSHPDVILAEMFDEASVANVTARWTNVGNNGSLSLDQDVPAGSAGTRSLKIIAAAGTNVAETFQISLVDAALSSSRFQPGRRSTVGSGSYWPGIFTGAPFSHAFTF